MAGMSSRFFKAGYTQPKYMLEAHNQSLFAHSIRSFSRYFSDSDFLFITLSDYDTPNFVSTECDRLNINSYEVITLDEVTRGQAETVALGLDKAGCSDTPITIFNIDTALPDFRHPDFIEECDGYLDVFVGSGNNWSYVRPDPSSPGKALETAEKKPISDLCSSGLYYFKSSAEFTSVFAKQISAGIDNQPMNEFYIAPLYNQLIDAGKDIRYRITDKQQVIFFGVPDEYLQLKKSTHPHLTNGKTD